MVKILMEEDSESTSQVVPQLVALLREILEVLLPEETSVVPPQAVLLERLTPSSLETLASRLRSGTSRISSVNAEKSLKLESLWETMAEQRASLMFNSHLLMPPRRQWSSTVLSSTEEQ